MLEVQKYAVFAKEHAQRVVRDERAQICAVILGFNALVFGQMFLFAQSLEPRKETRSSICLTQEQSDEIMKNVVTPRLGLLQDYVTAGAAIRLVYTSQQEAPYARQEGFKLKEKGVDVVVSAAEGVTIDGSVRDCRVALRVITP